MMDKTSSYISYVLQSFKAHCIEYILGLFVVLFSIITYQLLGSAITKGKEKSYSFVIGFVVFSFATSLLGLVVQFIDLPYMVFFFGMISIWVASWIYILYALKKGYFKIEGKQYLKENWFLYVGAFLLVGFALCHVKTLWENSNTDDAFYLSRMATAPFTSSFKNIEPSSGLKEKMMLSYLINTFEIEGSFYVYLFKLPVTLYARVFLSYLNYFVLLTSIKAFLIKLYENKTSLLTYVVPFVFLLVAMNPKWFLSGQETWTITSSAYLGSAFSRVGLVGIALLMLMEENKLTVKNVIFTSMVCTVLICKSSIVLPSLCMLALAYLLYISNMYLKIGLLILIGIAGFILPGSEVFNAHFQATFMLYAKNILFLIPILLGLGISIKNKMYRKFYSIVLVSIALCIIPEVCDIFEFTCYYYFVADRCLYSFAVALSLVTYAYCLIWLCDKLQKEKMMGRILRIGMVCCLAGLLAIKADGTNVVDSAKLYLKNMAIVPEGTIDLGKELEEAHTETQETLTIYTYTGLFDSGYGHFPHQIIRSFAPSVVSPVATVRTHEMYEVQNEFEGFHRDDVIPLGDFTVNPNEMTVEEIKNVMNAYPFNCIVGTNFNETHDYYLSLIGFEKYSDVLTNGGYTYSIYIKG